MKRIIKKSITASSELPNNNEVMISASCVFEFLNTIVELNGYEISMNCYGDNLIEYVIGQSVYRIVKE